MHNNYDFFAQRYAAATRWTLGAFIGMLIVSVFSSSGSNSISLAELNRRVETATWLLTRWENNNRPNIAALDNGDKDDKELKKSFDYLIKKRGAPFQNKDEVMTYLSELRRQRDDIKSLVGLNIFGLTVSKDSIIVKRWLVLMCSCFLFILALLNERDKITRAYSMALSGSILADVYECFAVCQGVLMAVPVLDTGNSLEGRGLGALSGFRNVAVRILIAAPILSFLGSNVAELYFSGPGELSKSTLIWNLFIAAVFTGLFLGTLACYNKNLKIWGIWYRSAKDLRRGGPAEGAWDFTVEVDDEEFSKIFNHTGSCEIRRDHSGLRVNGNSQVAYSNSNGNGGPGENAHVDGAGGLKRFRDSPWIQPNAVYTPGTLILLYRYSQKNQEVHVMCQLNVGGLVGDDDKEGKRMVGYYYQLNPAYFATSGRITLQLAGQ